MKEGFRQSMAWLHTWAGLLTGWLLFFVFVTGTAGYFDTEIGYWMRPELPQRVEIPAAAAADLARARLEEQAPNAQRWIIYPPSGRDIAEINVFWRTASDAAGRVASRSEVLDRATGKPLEARDTAGGETLYQMHYVLRYLPTSVAYWIVGVATMFMLVAIVSGVITHKKIFKDFFTFRPRKGQRSWLDAHNVLSVMALPFHLMITYSGLVFFCFTYVPLLIVASYGPGPEARTTFFDEVFQRAPERAPSGRAMPLVPFAPLVAAVEGRWGPHEIRSIDVQNVGDASAVVTFTRAHVTPTSNGERLSFDGATGERLPPPQARSGPMLFNDTMMSLHEGLFSGPVLRWLYFLSGLLGCAMVATGLVLWTAKRRKGAAHAGLALVERLNVGTIAGLPFALAAYFYANRLLPLDLAGRAAWEIDVLFIAWAAALVYAAARPLRRAWLEELAATAALFALLPLLNALTTEQHLGVTLAAGDWVRAGFDLTMLAFGLLFGGAAYELRRRTRAVAERDAGMETSLLAANDIEASA